MVLSKPDVWRVLDLMEGVPRLGCALIYGAGLRLSEALTLRVKDLDFERMEILVCRGKGQKDRLTPLLGGSAGDLRRQLRGIRRRHDQDLREGGGRVALPHALAEKYPNANREFLWQWVFPASRTYVDAETGERRRHYTDRTVVQRAFKEAARRAGVTKLAGTHTLRHYPERRIIPTRVPLGASKPAVGGRMQLQDAG